MTNVGVSMTLRTALVVRAPLDLTRARSARPFQPHGAFATSGRFPTPDDGNQTSGGNGQAEGFQARYGRSRSRNTASVDSLISPGKSSLRTLIA